MIEYVEIRDENFTDLIGIIDTAQSIIWHSVYFGVGDFEIYVQASPEIAALLQTGRFVTRPDDLEVGIIEAVAVADDPQSGTMITARGRFAKSILDRRIIYNFSVNTNKATILRGNVEEAIRRVVYDNAINCPFDSSRNFPLLELGELSNIPLVIVDNNGTAAQKQVSYDNLLTYTDSVLQEYGLAATVVLDVDARKLKYIVYSGVDRSADNAAGNDPIVFSKEFDNLTSSSYEYNTATEKNVALIGGEGEGLERFYSIVKSDKTGMQRREIFVDASSISSKYKDENEVEQSYNKLEYKAMLDAMGKQTLAANVLTETFDGVIDVASSQWRYNEHFALGDIVTIQNDDIGAFVNIRIIDVLEAQNENGYSIEASS